MSEGLEDYRIHGEIEVDDGHVWCELFDIHGNSIEFYEKADKALSMSRHQIAAVLIRDLEAAARVEWECQREREAERRFCVGA